MSVRLTQAILPTLILVDNLTNGR